MTNLIQIYRISGKFHFASRYKEDIVMPIETKRNLPILYIKPRISSKPESL